jgi:hypothetical protein
MIHSPGRNTTITHAHHHCTSTKCIGCYFERGNKLSCKSTVFSLCWPWDSVVSHLKWVGDTFSTHFLHSCWSMWVSTAALLKTQGQQRLVWVAHLSCTHYFLNQFPVFRNAGTFPMFCQAQCCTSIWKKWATQDDCPWSNCFESIGQHQALYKSTMYVQRQIWTALISEQTQTVDKIWLWTTLVNR